jgi:hypothetical protein
MCRHYTTFLSSFERESQLDERQCALSRAQCSGYDVAFGDWLAAYVLWELFVSRAPLVPIAIDDAKHAHLLGAITTIVDKLARASVQQRGSVDDAMAQLLAAIEASAATAAVPALSAKTLRDVLVR